MARQFYRFAANPSLSATFTSGEVWVGIENGLTSTRSWVRPSSTTLTAWEMDAAYAEASGPFSPSRHPWRDSGGYYELHNGVAASCATTTRPVPVELVGLRAISLTAPTDVTRACLEWWA